ncbi:MAG: ABC transporter permease subunit [Blautia marasmi]
MTIYSSAIKSIPENQFRAARVDGAGEWEIFKQIIVRIPDPHFFYYFMGIFGAAYQLYSYPFDY